MPAINKPLKLCISGAGYPGGEKILSFPQGTVIEPLPGYPDCFTANNTTFHYPATKTLLAMPDLFGDPSMLPPRSNCPRCGCGLSKLLDPGRLCSTCSTKTGYYARGSAGYKKLWPFLPPAEPQEPPISPELPKEPESPPASPEPSTAPLQLPENLVMVPPDIQGKLLLLLGQAEYDRYHTIRALESLLECL